MSECNRPCSASPLGVPSERIVDGISQHCSYCPYVVDNHGPWCVRYNHTLVVDEWNGRPHKLTECKEVQKAWMEFHAASTLIRKEVPHG
jgi:hypothetical protein